MTTQGPWGVCLAIITLLSVYAADSQRDQLLPREIRQKPPVEGEFFSVVVFSATEGFFAREAQVFRSLHHADSKVELVCKVKIRFHKEDCLKLINKNYPWFLLQHNHEAGGPMG